MHERSSRPTFSSTLDIVPLLNFCQKMSVQYVITVLICIFLIANDAENLFLCFFATCVSCLWYVCPCLFSIFLLGWFYFSYCFTGYFMYSSYSFLADFIIMNIFSLLISCLFILLKMCFFKQKFLLLIQSNLSIILIVTSFCILFTKSFSITV